mmetsp:Transcript_136093/g.322589  ORF Transcript_136093/g.322589 Transcript_136093/m.322589 type:complete len:238 (+) Transcript_136093:1330-2043(+)
MRQTQPRVFIVRVAFEMKASSCGEAVMYRAARASLRSRRRRKAGSDLARLPVKANSSTKTSKTRIRSSTVSGSWKIPKRYVTNLKPSSPMYRMRKALLAAMKTIGIVAARSTSRPMQTAFTTTTSPMNKTNQALSTTGTWGSLSGSTLAMIWVACSCRRSRVEEDAPKGLRASSPSLGSKFGSSSSTSSPSRSASASSSSSNISMRLVSPVPWRRSSAPSCFETPFPWKLSTDVGSI